MSIGQIQCCIYWHFSGQLFYLKASLIKNVNQTTLIEGTDVTQSMQKEEKTWEIVIGKRHSHPSTKPEIIYGKIEFRPVTSITIYQKLFFGETLLVFRSRAFTA